MSSLTGAQTLVTALHRHGVEVVFGIPGTHNLPIYSALAGSPIRHVAMRHEQGVGYAADGYARRSGRPGVAIVTAGPAVLNAATAAAQAWSDSVPLLLVSPGMPLAHPRASTGYLHELPDSAAALRGAMGHSVRVESHDELGRELADAFAGFAARRPRPVHLEIPLDLLAQEGEPAELTVVQASRPAPPREAVQRAAELLAGAERVAIVAGGGCRDAAAELRVIAERLGAGVVTTANGKGLLDERDPLSLSSRLHLDAVRDWLAAAEVVLAVGTELGESDLWQPAPRLTGTLIRLDIDPAQAHANLPAGVALVGDAAAGLRELAQALARRDPGATPPSADGLATTRRAAAEQAARLGARWEPWLSALRVALPPTATVVGDAAMCCYYGALGCLAIAPPGRFLYPSGLGTLGYAVPAAVGAALAQPPGPVVALSGDGGLMFSVAELSSATALGLALPVVVFVNDGYGEIRDEMRAAGFSPLAVDFPAPDLAALAGAFGGHSAQPTDPAELTEAVTTALDRRAPTVIAIREANP